MFIYPVSAPSARSTWGNRLPTRSRHQALLDGEVVNFTVIRRPGEVESRPNRAKGAKVDRRSLPGEAVKIYDPKDVIVFSFVGKLWVEIFCVRGLVSSGRSIRSKEIID
jgi:hypothetical protein